jgi:hypothetical protein
MAKNLTFTKRGPGRKHAGKANPAGTKLARKLAKKLGARS